MLKKTITFTDYNDVTRTEDYYFNLDKSELYEMEAESYGGYGQMLQRIIDSPDTKKTMEYLKDLILRAVGEKSPDGINFDKNDEISNRFYHSAAYDNLLCSMVENPDVAAEFAKGIIPKAMLQAVSSVSSELPGQLGIVK